MNLPRLTPMTDLTGLRGVLDRMIGLEDRVDRWADGLLRPAATSRVVRLDEWALPPVPLDLELVSVLPTHPTTRPPLLFVHGLFTGAWAWRDWMREAADAGWPCYAVSLRGHGDSPGGGPVTLARDYVQDVLQAITQLPRPPVLIGHSFGALVVQYVLERYPAPAAVLVCPTGADTGLRTVLRVLARHPVDAARFALGVGGRAPLDMMLSPAADDAAVRRFQERSVPARSPVVLQVAVHARPRLQRCPLLVLGSTADPMVPESDVRRTARQYGATLVTHPGMSHGLMMDDGWQAPLATMLDWLGEAVPDRTDPPNRTAVHGTG